VAPEYEFHRVKLNKVELGATNWLGFCHLNLCVSPLQIDISVNLQIFIPYSASLISDEKSRHPALERLLAAGKHTRHVEPLTVMLCQMAGVSQQTDWPIASLCWLGEGGQAEAAYWLRADPVHFVLQRDSFSLGEPVALSRQDAQTLMTVLNEHFAPDGLRFFMAGSGRWYLRLDANPEVSTTLLETAMGRDVSAYLPQGTGMAKWNRLLNEMQMLLHDHPLNQARVADGKLPVNSVWLSGGGVLPARFETSPRTIFSNNALAIGLGLTADYRCLPLPENLEAIINQAGSDAWLVLDDVDEAEEKWFAPALARLRAGLRAGKIRQLTLHFAAREQVLSVDIRPRDLWKFWRKARPLRAYLA
jgi:hypothetical protein